MKKSVLFIVLFFVVVCSCKTTSGSNPDQADKGALEKRIAAYDKVSAWKGFQRYSSGDSKTQLSQDSSDTATTADPIEFVNMKFTIFNQERLQQLNATLSKVPQSRYREFLQNRKDKATASQSVAISIAHLLNQYLRAETIDIQDSLARCIKEVCNSDSLTREELAAIDALSPIVDTNGILTAGLVLDVTHDGDTAIKPVLKVEGQVLLLTPQTIYGWPEEESSALGVVNPQDGPFKVIKAITFEDNIGTHSDTVLWSNQYNGQKKVPLELYLTYSRNSYLYIEDEKNKKVGWLNIDSCAFFDSRMNDGCKMSADFYRNGLAWHADGWWSDTNYYETNAERDVEPTHIERLWYRNLYDFKRLIITSKGYGAFYSKGIYVKISDFEKFGINAFPKDVVLYSKDINTSDRIKKVQLKSVNQELNMCIDYYIFNNTLRNECSNYEFDHYKNLTLFGWQRINPSIIRW